ncbi:MAG: hypothetical protein H0U28_00255 [Nocardioidaceae bacterium]|nr:hypothetical protein [Nocardioidaceae bacterium]
MADRSGEASTTSYERDETMSARLDRNYNELLQELRVMQAGIQILFGFLLSLAFQSRFTAVSDFQRDVYVVTLVSATLATGFLVAPVPFHRLVFGRRMKDDLIRAATRYVAAGLVFLFTSISGATLLVLDFLLSRGVAVATTSVIGVVFVVLWVAIPMRARAQSDVGVRSGGGRRRA